ncbi:RNA polymerase sigma-70 factor (ECF subfamily) [Granulicella aggregans]|uniref:RNA polymerase sigma-70 factor (ECF subfamily) n=1 Tax=Granulicella aggregans TaxID=474949 RepID=A0A7W7ZEQ8_9BACT|nr:sigma-70 family RNA polymerase sigma factor [Granulicella aggregans]MBB5058570.1 RNA polymerase sigma-70 factor (ECF subfamily) [Granulicella aggregans]
MTSFEGYSLVLPSAKEAESQEIKCEIDLPALVGTYSTLLFRVAHSVLRSRSDAEDVVQDAFVRVLENRSKLPEVREMRVWLVRIAWNLALDRRRRIRPDQMDEVFAQSLVATGTPADQALHEAQQMNNALREIEKLPDAERNVLLLSAIEELGTTEIALVLKKSESAVRALLFRARTRLRERLAKGGKR